jgi:RNA polymerase sigma factor (sigma-70 family)
MAPVDRKSFEILVRANQAQLWRYARYLGADVAYSEDLVQDTFLAALKSDWVALSTDAPEQAAYLRGILRNTFLAGCRRMKVSPVRVSSESVEAAEAAWQSEFLRGGDGFDYLEALRGCLKLLDEKGRRFLDLLYDRGQSRQEIGAAFHMTPDGVKTTARRIRSRLGDCVRRKLGPGAG